MLEKEYFIDTLEEIRSLYNKQDNFCSALENLGSKSDGTNIIVPLFLYDDCINIILHLLEECLNDNTNEIEHFLYDLGAIFFDKDIKLYHVNLSHNNNENYLYTDVDSLYDYLVNKIGDNNAI